MNSFDYNKASTVAGKIINKFGSPATITLTGSTGGYDSQGNVKPDQPDYNISGTATPIINYKLDEVDGDKIVSGDGWILFKSEEEPLIGMLLTVGSDVWRVVNVMPLESLEGVVIRRKLHLRK